MYVSGIVNRSNALSILTLSPLSYWNGRLFIKSFLYTELSFRSDLSSNKIRSIPGGFCAVLRQSYSLCVCHKNHLTTVPAETGYFSLLTISLWTLSSQELIPRKTSIEKRIHIFTVMIPASWNYNG